MFSVNFVEPVVVHIKDKMVSAEQIDITFYSLWFTNTLKVFSIFIEKGILHANQY